MNNESNQEADVFETNFFNWLLEKPDFDTSLSSADHINPVTDLPDDTSLPFWEGEELDPLESEEFDDFSPNSSTPHLLEWAQYEGEIPTVENRFYALLKKRLKAEIESHPPRFPWEMSFVEDEFEYPESYIDEQILPSYLWSPQVQNLRWGLSRLPITESLFTKLLEPCQNLLFATLGKGAKLLEVVENLFPGQSRQLNDVAGLVLNGALRATEVVIPEYDSATVEQQMVLSLIATLEIFDSLTLICPLNNAPTERNWQTRIGLLNLRAQYQSSAHHFNGRCLRVECELPDGGSIHLHLGDDEARAQRFDRGYLSVELFDPQPDRLYSLSIELPNHDDYPLKFAICPTLTVNG